MKALGIFLVVLAAFASGAYLSNFLEHRTGAAPFSNGGIRWKSSIRESLKEAKARHLPMFIDFYADWCTYCKQMDRTTYQDSAIVGLSEHFVCAKMNIDKHPDLAQYFHVEGLPTLVFIDAGSGSVKRLEGYVPAADLAAAMTEVAKAK